LSEREILEIKEGLIVINIVLDDAATADLQDIWRNKVEGIQSPLVETYKNGMHVTIPWVLKDE